MKVKNKLLKGFIKIVDNPKTNQCLIPVVSVFMSMVIVIIMLLCLGKNPLSTLGNFLQGCGLLPKKSYAGGKGMLTDFTSFLDIMSPMLMACLGVVIAQRAGLLNIGISGQMVASGFVASVVVGYSSLNPWLAKPLALLCGMAAGSVIGACIGFLKRRFNIHEVISAVMFNWIVNYTVAFFIKTYFADPVTRSSRVISSASRLTLTDVPIGGLKVNLPLGFVLAIISVFLVRFVLKRTTMGYEFEAVGRNAQCARYAGINVGKNTITAMTLSGMMAGAAGVMYFMGYYNTITPNSLPDMGFDSIAVALLGNNNPVGCIFAAAFITIFQKGSVYMSSAANVTQEIAAIITGLLLLFSACGAYLNDNLKTLSQRYHTQNEKRNEKTNLDETGERSVN